VQVLRVLLVHNFYQQSGGEDFVFLNEARLLRSKGHEVFEYTDHNDRIQSVGNLHLAIATVWNRGSKEKLESVLRESKPDIVHFHNTFPLISPAAYYACRSYRVAIVQTLHNYRLLCPAANFHRDGKICEECLGKGVPWPGIVHGCYRENRITTAVVASMLAFHRAARTWSSLVDLYIALSEFSREKFIQGGLPESKITVKPNFLFSDPGFTTGRENYVISAGRLSLEKGTLNLLSAWKQLPIPVPLHIFGEGPLRREVQSRVQNLGLEQISLLGQVPHSELLEAIKKARFMIFPSGCYENFPMAVIEAFACGIPALVSRRGAMREIVENGSSGLHFDPDNPKDIAAKVEWAWTHPEELAAMGRTARRVFETSYSAELNYKPLQQIYARARNRSATAHLSFNTSVADS